MIKPQAVAFSPSVAVKKPTELETAVDSTIRGKREVVRLGKTTLAHALARSIDCSFHGLQFTSDMLPGV